MSSLAEQYDRIERYLQGAMTPGEMDEFNQKLNNDPELASAVTLHQELAETLAGDRIHQFRKTLQEVNANWKPATGGRWLRVLKSPQNLAIAASLLLLIGFFGWWSFQTPSGAELASENFEQLPVQAFMSLDSGDAQVIRKSANQAYIAGEYEAAAEQFEALTELAPGELSYQLYLGVSQVGANAAADAVNTLKPLADGTDQSVKSEAAWYLALAYLQMEEKTAARPYLDQLVRTGGFGADDAEKLINMLY
ncbi:tetratricopeptide repeat protein [Flavilitoribacter nigricans]|uniref:Tetratricopeptide repeat protein n=1 Tax=Flavilitoribacter nigricans (strain ATCC 23147 / DSM 23189 / NBRC 102662 / NCIMB 1420 / SS-2) TaxID=1122177 RepID=A0A2D0NIF2_FLAN2|nr:hypothetical protein [Flavilitoribacter nigricans]PHN07969.1 hypothetical protein CRP01_04235 [Flavilitoribacter nigricans DSM 23189 = NBRC 102662]